MCNAENTKATIGDGLLLLNDHGPMRLFHQVHAKSHGKFTWDYLDEGPDFWQVRIGKEQNAAPKVCGH